MLPSNSGNNSGQLPLLSETQQNSIRNIFREHNMFNPSSSNTPQNSSHSNGGNSLQNVASWAQSTPKVPTPPGDIQPQQIVWNYVRDNYPSFNEGQQELLAQFAVLITGMPKDQCIVRVQAARDLDALTNSKTRAELTCSTLAGSSILSGDDCMDPELWGRLAKGEKDVVTPIYPIGRHFSPNIIFQSQTATPVSNKSIFLNI